PTPRPGPATPSAGQPQAVTPAPANSFAATPTPTDRIGPATGRRRAVGYAALAITTVLVVMAAGLAVSHRRSSQSRPPVRPAAPGRGTPSGLEPLTHLGACVLGPGF